LGAVIVLKDAAIGWRPLAANGAEIATLAGVKKSLEEREFGSEKSDSTIGVVWREEFGKSGD